MTPHKTKAGVYRKHGKRLFDLLGAGLALLLCVPVLAAVALLVLLLQGPPVLFRQVRPGKRESPFTLIKFCTMRPDAGDLPDSERLTRLGAALRRTSLDELPSLWNVVRGEMSLVGPRPLLVEYLELYSPEQRRRHEVLPGLTGWAQVNGRNALTWPEKFAYDLWYVDQCSFALDLRILALTLLQVFSGRGVSASDHATMPRFEGNKDE